MVTKGSLIEKCKVPLIEEIKKKCISYGKVILTSGKESDFYIDLRKLVFSDKINLIVEYLTVHLYPFNFNVIGGPETGANAIVGALLCHHYSKGFIIRKKIKDHGKGNLVIGNLEPGDQAVIIEDVTTTGHSLLHACNVVRDVPATIVQAISIVDREDGASELMERNNIDFHSCVKVSELL